MIEKRFSLSQKVSFVKFWFPAAMPLKKVLLSLLEHVRSVDTTDGCGLTVRDSIFCQFVSFFSCMWIRETKNESRTNLSSTPIWFLCICSSKWPPVDAISNLPLKKINQDLWQNRTYVTSFTNVLLQRNRLSLHPPLFVFLIEHITTTRFWPNVLRNIDYFAWISQTSPPLSVHNIILCRTIALSLSHFAVSPDSVDGCTSCSPGCCSDRWGGETNVSSLCFTSLLIVPNAFCHLIMLLSK